MNVEEAKKVLWLKSNPRPLGELVDQGYLTRDRLEWAAKCAYSPRLKEAAQALLENAGQPQNKSLNGDSSNSPIELGMSLEKARATAWPFPPFKGQPMGTLVESKQLSLKDLGYAVENAWEEKVRQAAVTLSLVRLDQIVKEPKPSAGFIHIVSGGRSFAERKQMMYTMIQGIVSGFIVSILFIFAIWTFVFSFTNKTKQMPVTTALSNPSILIAIGVIFALAFGVMWLIDFIQDRIMKSLDKQIDEHRRGQEGEERVVQLIIQALDGSWSLFRNINLPGRNKGDLDLVLVGPPGVWVLEVKNYRGDYRNIGETWEYRSGNKWKLANGNPSRQAVNNAVRLANFLKADHVNAFVNPAVVWANDESHPKVVNPATAVWLYNQLPDELGNIWQGEKLNENERQKIIFKLTALCENQESKGKK